MKPEIINEDEYIIVLNKPSGLVVHPFDYSTEYTLVDFLYEKYPEIFVIENKIKLQDGREISLGGIVHKLDRDTSGVIVIAKTQKVFDELKEQFKNHTVEKVYVALVEGIIEKDSFTIDAPLGRSRKDYKQSTAPEKPRGELRPAITEVEVSARGGSASGGKNTTLVKLFPKTGRTHQLRAHMSSIGHPIVGDKAYGGKVDSSRIMLHAEKICFILNEKTYEFEVPPPNDFTFETTK